MSVVPTFCCTMLFWRAFALARSTAPEVTNVVPERTFAPVSFKVPAPLLVRGACRKVCAYRSGYPLVNRNLIFSCAGSVNAGRGARKKAEFDVANRRAPLVFVSVVPSLTVRSPPLMTRELIAM